MADLLCIFAVVYTFIKWGILWGILTLFIGPWALVFPIIDLIHLLSK